MINKKIYIKKIKYYSDKIKNDKSEFNKLKLQKYLIKLGGGKIDCSNKKLPLKLEYDTSRTPSYCDRILYKSNKMKITNYGVYTDNPLIRLSDHLLVYGEFIFNGKKCIVLTWNIADANGHDIIVSGISKLIVDFGLLSNNYEMIICCLQESSSNDEIPKILIRELNIKYKISSESSESLLNNFNVRLIVFHLTEGLSVKSNTMDIKILHPNISSSSTILNIEPRLFKSIANNKTCVGFTIDGLTILSCHFPLNTSEKDFGNDLRIQAMKQIKQHFSTSNDILLAGDLNFRMVDNNDQLKDYLKNDSTFKEFTPPLTIPTCKLNVCK